MTDTLSTTQIRETYSLERYRGEPAVGKQVLQTVHSLCDDVDRKAEEITGLRDAQYELDEQLSMRNYRVGELEHQLYEEKRRREQVEYELEDERRKVSDLERQLRDASRGSIW